MSTAYAVLTAVLVAETLIVGSLVVTILTDTRVWPPPGRSSWQYRFTWNLTAVAVTGTILLGVLDWDSFVLNHWLRLPAGGILIMAGLACALWGVRELSVHASLGLGGELMTTGPYRYSRNPQYVGDIACCLGYAVLCNSVLTLIGATVGCLWFVLAPFAEEPWLAERFGGPYDDYRAKTPRFLGWPRH